MTSKTLELQVPMTTWYSSGDEESFFRWLYSIKGYTDCKGCGRVLHIRFALADIDRSSMQELVALFKRYNMADVKQLRPLSESRHGPWFSSPENYWHDHVFSD